jgi:Raf kinase inhibitor-like YbhB/YbcL family protein
MLTKILRSTFAVLLALAACAALAQQGGGRPPLVQLVVESTAFEDGGIVPDKYAGRTGVQPGFKFSNVPSSVVSYAIIFHDLDVALNKGTGDVLHWIVWNIPASAGGIPEGSLPAGAVQGKNIAGQNAYFGPGAPPGPRYHHYTFEIYALDGNLDLPSTAGRDELLAAMAGHVIAKAAYVGRFKGKPTPAQ